MRSKGQTEELKIARIALLRRLWDQAFCKAGEMAAKSLRQQKCICSAQMVIIFILYFYSFTTCIF